MTVTRKVKSGMKSNQSFIQWRIYIFRDALHLTRAAIGIDDFSVFQLAKLLGQLRGARAVFWTFKCGIGSPRDFRGLFGVEVIYLFGDSGDGRARLAAE